LKVRDVRDKDIVYLRENKRGKERKCIINPELKGYIVSYISDKQGFQYLFKSQKGNKLLQERLLIQSLKMLVKHLD